MSLDAKVAILVGVIAVITAFAGAIRFLVGHYLSELKPNSGGSLNDRVARVETRVDEIYTLLLSRHAD